MIKNNEHLSIVEVIDFVKKLKTENSELIGFGKRFISEDVKTAKKIKEQIQNLNLLKVKPEHTVKIIDLMPDNAQDLNKIFTDVGLDEDETKKILEVIKENK